MKAHAPPPPQAPQPAPRHIFRNTAPDGGGTSGMDAKENILRPTVDVQLTLPQGQRVSITEDGSKALMDLLVELCSHYHLNPALHTLELLSPEGHSLGFKPNALLGSLNVACVLIKEKVLEEKVVRRPAPKVPEKTVRLMVNYHGSQKAVVRVNPLVPLQTLIPVICDKCEFEPAHVLLLKDSISRHELQLDKSLSELGIKECSHKLTFYCLPPFLSLAFYQMGLGSESQQRKRKAPAPPPTPTSLTQGSDDASTSAAPSPDGQATEIPTPAFRTTVVQSTTVSTATVVMETVKPGPIKIEAQPPPVSNATPTPSSPTPSSSTTDSLVVQDSSSELSHSLDDSDADLDQAGSHCSTLTSSTASGSVWVNATTKSSSSKMEESATVIVVKLKEEVTSDSSSRSETESALNLKLDEVENNRHSAMEDKQISVKSNAEMQKKPKKTEKSPDPVKKNSQSFQQKKTDLPMSQRLVSTEKEEENHRVYQIKSNSGSSHGKITHVTSRFGMKTFTVVPPKPSVTHTAGEQPAVPFTAGAIRIDDQGNMVSSGVFRNKVGGSSETEINRSEGSPLVGQAKAFWSSNEKQESAVIPSKGLIDKAKESTNGEKIQLIELVKEEANEPAKDVKAANEEYSKVESKISVRDLSFLKPSRRTSSQYVASAISKYTPMTSAKPISTPKTPDYSASSKTPSPGLQRLGQSIQVNPHQSSLSYVSDNKENVSTSTSRSPGPKRSMSSPEYVGGFKSSVVSTKESLGLLETETAKNNHIHSSGPTHIKVTANNDRDYNKHIRQRSPSPAKTSTLHSYTATPLTTNGKPQPSVTVTDSAVTPPAVTVFGPIAKFKPVIYRSVEKETSLHSNLMEAIQTGGGRDRLKKVRSGLTYAASSSSTVFTAPPPPPPPAPMTAPPPPPPPVLPQAKPSSVAHPNANAPMNLALAREAMLEAIRSGSAAERLKKVQIQKNT
uniref:Cordon-bleu WH2 repeat protein n=1 Tax=Stegastes partitus TaxID=144197 RepID=A0A3B5B587_9TELE